MVSTVPSALPSALSFILEGASGLRMLDYGDAGTFTDLWHDGLKANTHSASTHLLVCGASPPQHAFDFLKQPGMPPADIAQHFTAYSWAAAFRLINPDARLTIMIIESTVHSLAQGVGADLRCVFAAREPCLGVTCLCLPELSAILNAIANAAPRPLSIGTKGMLRGVIQQHLLPNPEDHHKMGNIVGALMLAPEPETGNQILGALFRALEPETKFEDRVELPEVDEALRMRVKKGPTFILFDDMGSLWAPFIKRWIPEGRLHIPPVNADSRKKLAGKLKALASNPVQLRRLNATDFGVTTIADGEPIVLLLDLRLFAGDQRDQEVHFFDQLKEAAQWVGRATHLKWPTIGKDEIDEGMRAWYEKQTFTPAFRKTRSWLPRLISLIDPTLPIVIFSSTQDSEVLRQFRGYGNIVTDFSKPMFRGVLGETREWAGAATLAFEKALHSAMRISSAQKLLWDILGSAKRSEDDAKARKMMERSEEKGTNTTPQPGESFPEQVEVSTENRTTTGQAARAIPPEQGAKPARVEIFIDESGTASQTRFALGAVILISGINAFDHAAYRTNAVRDRNLGLWGLDDIVKIRKKGDLPTIKWLRKGKDLQIGTHGNPNNNHNQKLEETLGRIQKLVTDQGGRLFACSLLSQEQPVPNDTTSLRHPYHRYRDVLTRLLEAILFHFEPVVKAIQSGAEICVDAATAKNDADDWNLISLWKDFGAERFTDYDKDDRSTGEKCRTLGCSHVLPLVMGLLVRYRRDREGANRRDKDPAARVVHRARAAQLSNRSECGNNTLSRQDRVDPKPLHHLADWIAHFTWDTRDWSEVPKIATLKSWFESGFRQIDDQEFRSRLRSLRQWAQGVRIDAIGGWKKVENAEDFALTPRMAKGAARWMEDLTADDLTTLFHSQEPN